MVDVDGHPGQVPAQLVREDLHVAGQDHQLDVELGDQIAQLKAQLQRMRPSDDEQTYHSLFADLVALEQARKDLIARAFR